MPDGFIRKDGRMVPAQRGSVAGPIGGVPPPPNSQWLPTPAPTNPVLPTYVAGGPRQGTDSAVSVDYLLVNKMLWLQPTGVTNITSEGIGNFVNGPVTTTPGNVAVWDNTSGSLLRDPGWAPAPLNSPAFTGAPTAPSPPDGASNGEVATAAFVLNEIALRSGLPAIGPAPPASPRIGSLWWDSVGGQLYIWFFDGNSYQWVIANNVVGMSQAQGDGRYLQLSGGTLTGELQVNAPTGAQAANFFRYGYGASSQLLNVQSAGSDTSTTNYVSLSVQQSATQDNDGIHAAQGALSSTLQVNGKSTVDLYAIHALTYMTNLASDLTPYPGDGSSQHGAIVAQTVKTLPAGGVPTGKMMPDGFTNWWQTVNNTNLGSALAGGDLALEADIVGNGPDDIWKLGPYVRTGSTTSGSPTVTGLSNTTPFSVGQTINIGQSGNNYIQCRVASLTSTSITMDTNATATMSGAVVAPQGGIRMSFQNTLALSAAIGSGGLPMEWMYGHYQNNVPNAVWGVGFAYYGAYYVAASDYSQGMGEVASPYSADGINRAVAIKLRAGQKVAFDGDGYRGTWLTGVAGGGLNVVKDGSTIASFDAAGNFSAQDNVTASGTLQSNNGRVVSYGGTTPALVVYNSSAIGSALWNDTSGSIHIGATDGAGNPATSLATIMTNGEVDLGLAGGDVVVGPQATVPNAATSGFLVVPYCGGTPTGVPANHTKGIALVYDVVTHRLFAYEGGAWKASSVFS